MSGEGKTCKFCASGDRPDLSPYLGKFIHRANRDHECATQPIKDVPSLLCNLAQILNVVKQEWGESWSWWDEQQLQELSRLQRWLLVHEPPGGRQEGREVRRKAGVRAAREQALKVVGPHGPLADRIRALRLEGEE